MGKGMDGTSTSTSTATATATATASAFMASTTAARKSPAPPSTTNVTSLSTSSSAATSAAKPPSGNAANAPKTSPVIPFLSAVANSRPTSSAPPASASTSAPSPPPPQRRSAQPNAPRPTSVMVPNSAASGSSTASSRPMSMAIPPSSSPVPPGTSRGITTSNSGGNISGGSSKESLGTRIRRLTIKRTADTRKNAPVRGCICHLNDRDKNGVCNGCDKRIGPYVVIKKIGEGSFSKVQLAYHVISRKKFALKLVNKQSVKNLQEVTNQIKNEVELLKGIKGQARNLFVKIEEFFETDNLFCLVMEFCEGGDLFSRVSSNYSLKEEDAREYFAQIVIAVKTLHELGICHRDLKLENFLLDGYDRIKLADFGLSKAFVTNGSDEADLLSTYCGTTDYAAPEVLRNQPYDGRLTDIWSIGVVLFAMLSGCFPFKNVNNQMGGIFSFPPSMSPESKELISRILVVNPRNRLSLDKILQHPWCAKSKFLNQPILPLPSTSPTPSTPKNGHHKSSSVPNANFVADSLTAQSAAKVKVPLSAPTSPVESPSVSPSATPVPFETTNLSDSSNSNSPVPRPRSTSTPLRLPTSASAPSLTPGVPQPPPPPPPPAPSFRNAFNNFTHFVHQRFRSDEGLQGGR